MNETAKSRIFLILSILAALFAAACSSDPGDPPLKGAKIGGAFSLLDQDGRTVTDRDFLGRYRIAYFGFSHCPDACPTDLAVIGQALTRFEKQDAKRAAKVVPTFVSVDPERDSPAVLKEYVASFHPRLVGLSGTPKQVADAARVHAVYYSKDEVQPGGGYNVNHPRYVILFGPDGKPIAFLPADQGAEAVASELDRWVR